MPPACSLKRTVRQPTPVAVGRTHASSVIAVVRSSEATSATVTQLELPLNESAPPYLPAVVHAVFVATPSLLLPDVSRTDVPRPSSNAGATGGMAPARGRFLS